VDVHAWDGVNGTGTELSGRLITATSSDPTKATVTAQDDSPGVFSVTPLAQGTTTLAFTCEGITVTVVVTVNAPAPPVTQITTDAPGDAKTIQVGAADQAVVFTFRHADNSAAVGVQPTFNDPAPSKFTRTLSNGGVTNASGQITVTLHPVAQNTATNLTASIDGVTKNLAVTVDPAAPPNPLFAFIASLVGGDSAIVGTWDTGDTALDALSNGAAVSSLPEARRASGIPAMTQATAGLRPTWDATNRVIVCAASGQTLNTGQDAVLDFGGGRARTLALIMAVDPAGTGYFAGWASGGGANGTGFRDFADNYGVGGGGTNTTDAGVPMNAAQYALILFHKAADGTLTVELPNQSPVAAGSHDPASGTMEICIGDFANGFLAGKSSKFKNATLFSRLATADDKAKLNTFATTYRGVTLS
jgi:hypothetical protein